MALPSPNTIYNGGYQTSGGTVTLSNTGAAAGTITSGISITGNTANWATPNAHFHNGQGQSVMTIPHGENKVVLEDKAELEVKGRVRINGEYLDERLERIETLLHIPSRDTTMEDKYPKLKELWEAYNRELAKYKTWDRMKDSE